MTTDILINTKEDIFDNMLRYINHSLAEIICTKVKKQEEYYASKDKSFKGIVQEVDTMFYIPGSTWNDFMQGILTQGKYQDTILSRSMHSFDIMDNGQGILSEKIFFTDSRKSCIVVNGQCAVAYQNTNGRWNMYSPEKGIDFPWVNVIRKKYRLGELSNLPRTSWIIKESHHHRDNMKKRSIYGKSSGCECKQFGYINSTFLEVKEVNRPSNNEVILDVWWNLGEDAKAERICIKSILMCNINKHDRNSKVPFSIAFDKISDLELLPIQKELSHQTLAEKNPYNTQYEFEGEPIYKGAYLWITHSGRPWLLLDNMFVPVDRDAITFICEKNPDHPAIHEYIIWKRLSELK